VVGGAGKTLSLYDVDKSFIVTNSVTVSNKHVNPSSNERIINIYVSSNDGITTLTTKNQVGAFNFYILNSFRLDAEASSIEQFFPSGFHNKKVNQLSVSVTKQLMASCSEDNTVKIWNFFEHEGYKKRDVLTHAFHEELLSVSLHPSRLFVEVGLSSSFKIFATVNDTLAVLKEAQTDNCRFIKYSRGGHFLLVNKK
jgi:WD40 repeat protein